MIAGLREARHELVAFADSDIRPDGRALAVLAETLLAAPDAGSAFAPVVVPVRARTVGDAGYSLLLNGLYGPAAASSTLKNGGELPFIMGQFMIFRRRAIAAIGGLESAEGQLVDDMYLGARIKAAGLRNRVSPHAVPIIQEGLPFGEFWKTYLRWLTFSRSGLPGRSFKWSSWMHGVSFWAGLLCFAAALLTGHPIVAAAAALVPLSVSMSINSLHRRLGGAPLGLRFSWVAFMLLVLAPAVMLSALLRRRVEWRGRSYSLDAGARLATRRVARSDDPSPRAA
jgi:cellulose synthase/poly-beta-1,6-N-acetylglucosamine synthase-like glycosyltransferase